jgi:PadR family transcriptional regulator AphA
MPRENKSKYAVLGFLSMGPMSGYDIKKMFEQSIINFWNESYGQIYPILKRLVEEGLATRSVVKQMGKPDRHVYELTDSGKEQLHQWLTEPAEEQKQRIEILLKLFFGRQVAVKDHIRHVRQFSDFHHQSLQKLESIEGWLKMDHEENPDLPYWLMTVSYGQHVYRALACWCDETLATLNKMAEIEDMNK